MALDQNIGMVTAYAYAVSKGYTGTEEQFAQELASAGADLSQIQTQIDNFINTIVPAKTAEVTAEGTRQIGLVAAEGTAQKNAVTAEGTTQKNAVISEGTTQKNAVNSAGSTQVNAVNSAGSTQVGNVNTAGSTQVGAVQAKGQEVINSIPSDYSELSDDVDDLKSALEDETETVNAQTTIYADSWIDANGVIAQVGGYSRTDYVSLANVISFTVSSMNLGNYIYYCFYTDDYSPLGARQRCYNDTAVTIPSGASYIIITSSSANMTGGTILLERYTRITVLENEVESVSRVNDLTVINPSSLLVDYMIKASDGSAVSTNVFVCTDFLELPFEVNRSIDVIGSFVGTGGCAIYDGEKQIILGIDGNNVATYGGTSGLTVQRITVPYQTGMKYIRISGVKSIVQTDATKLGVVGCTFNGVFADLFPIEESVTANIPNSIAKSKVLVIGDSISTDAYGNYNKWVTDLIRCGYLPADTNNSSQHATGFVATANGLYDNFVTRLEAITDPSTYDLVIVFGGINDYLQNIPMGSETGTDYTVSFKPAVNEFFSFLMANFTQARLCVLLPLRSYHTNKNTENEYQQAYADYIKQVAKSYCLPILNLTEESGFCPFITAFKDRWTLVPSGQTIHDGVHPNAEYESKYLAPMIRHFLQGVM